MIPGIECLHPQQLDLETGNWRRESLWLKPLPFRGAFDLVYRNRVPFLYGCYIMQSAPHERLFARVPPVVHHAGAGTTAAGLRAGRPSLITPLFGDQPFWGRLAMIQGPAPSRSRAPG